jgi:cytochrome c5
MSDAASHEHQSFIKTPTQLVVVCVLSFVIPVVGLILFVQLVLGGINKDPVTNSVDAVNERIKPVAQVNIASGGGGGAAKSAEEIYTSTCQACHGAGVAGAPKMGDAAAWRKYVAEGQKSVVADAIKGIRGMPAKGGNPDLSDYEFERTVVYMVNKSGGNFKDPPAPAAKPAAKAAK